MGESNYERLFGTPEKVIETLEWMEVDMLNWCRGIQYCEKCPYEFDRYGCSLPDGFSWIEWLESEAES
jgi:hypothetical protein